MEKLDVELFIWGCIDDNQFKSIENSYLPKKIAFEG